MLGAGRNDIDAGGVDAAVPEDVGEFGNVFFKPVKYTGKKVSEVMGKDLFGQNARGGAERFHVPPNIRPAQRFSAVCDEDTSLFDLLSFAHPRSG